MTGFFKDRPKAAVAAGLLCATVVAAGFFAGRLADRAAVEPQCQVLTKLDAAVSVAVKSRAGGYYGGEYMTEGHIILDTEEENGEVKVYALTSIGWFGFENGIFTKTSGSEGIPTLIIFFRNEDGEYSLLEYNEALDGELYYESIKGMFPRNLWDKVDDNEKNYAKLKRQQEIQAEGYLKSIGRTARVSADYVEKQSLSINVEASNKLNSHNDFFRHNCPFWIGTRERVEDGVRYIYETAQDKTSDGCDLIIFRKLKENGHVVEERKYKIVGNEPQLVN